MGKKIQKNSDPEQRSLLATSDQEGSELNSNLSSDSELEEENENSSLSDQNENSPLEPDLNNSSSSESDEEESQKEKKEENNVDPKVRTQRFVRLDLRKKTGDKESHKENQKWGRKDFVDFEQKVITEDNNKNPVFVFSENFPDCFLATNGMHYHSRNRANLADALRPKKDDEHNVTKVAGVPTLDYSVDKEKTLEERIDESFEYLYWLVGQGHTLVPIYRKKAKNDELEPAFGGGVAKDFSTEHYKHICNRFKQLEDFCEYLDSSSEEKYSDENAKKMLP